MLRLTVQSGSRRKYYCNEPYNGVDSEDIIAEKIGMSTLFIHL